jgi:hypothetical protein
VVVAVDITLVFLLVALAVLAAAVPERLRIQI